MNKLKIGIPALTLAVGMAVGGFSTSAMAAKMAEPTRPY